VVMGDGGEQAKGTTTQGQDAGCDLTSKLWTHR
jgi:hypothetical protein